MNETEIAYELEMLAELDPYYSPEARRCRVCGCTDKEPCVDGCWWVKPDLCSRCASDEEGGQG